MPSAPAIALPPKIKTSAKRRALPASLSGATLLARARSGQLARGIDWTAVSLAHESRRKRTRAA